MKPAKTKRRKIAYKQKVFMKDVFLGCESVVKSSEPTLSRRSLPSQKLLRGEVAHLGCSISKFVKLNFLIWLLYTCYLLKESATSLGLFVSAKPVELIEFLPVV